MSGIWIGWEDKIKEIKMTLRKNEDIGPACMIYQGERPHPAHRVFGNAIGCEYKHFEGRFRNNNGGGSNIRNIFKRAITGIEIPSKYNVVVAEGSSVLQTMLVYKTVKNRRSKCIYLAADETFHTLQKKKTRHVWKLIKPFVNISIDGCISVSDLAYEWCKPHIGSVNHEIVHPPIGDEKYDSLIGLTPKSSQENFTVVSIGNNRDSKNYARLGESFGKIVNTIDSDAKLIIVGSGHENERYSKEKYIQTPGNVSIDRLTDILNEASVYIQPSISDAFPVASLEAMLSATPTIVTDQVGTKTLIPENQIVSATVDGIYEGIKKLHEMSEKDRIKTGNAHREEVSDLTEKNQAEKFNDAIMKLMRNNE